MVMVEDERQQKQIHDGDLDSRCPEPEEKVFKGAELFGKSTKPNAFKVMFAFAIWLGAVQILPALLVVTFFFLSLSQVLMVFALLLVLMFIPIDEESKFGQGIYRYTIRHACGYFPVNLIVEDIKAFNHNRAYVFGYEPHSVFPIGITAFSDQLGFMPRQKMKLLASSAIFYTPLMRHVLTWCRVSPATRKNFTSLLSSGVSCILIPGGVQEAFFLERGSEIIFLRSRKGFVRIAMQMGVPLVPVFCFGQSYVYNWWKPRGSWFLKFARAIKFTPIFFWGVFGSPLPFRRQMDVVVGKPIELEKNSEPTMEEVIKAHGKFVEALQDLFERNKARLGYPNLQLKIL